MKFSRTAFLVLSIGLVLAGSASAQSWATDAEPLIAASCLDCHDATTSTRLNFETLGHDLADPSTFRRWEKILDRASTGTMPPADEPRPDPILLQTATAGLNRDLIAANLDKQRRRGRVPARRLTRLEYEYTLRDLLAIHDDLANSLPEESNSGGFDTVGASQGISPIHIRGYLAAASQALDSAIQLGPRPQTGPRLIDYRNSPYFQSWYDKPLNMGGSNFKELEDGVALFVDYADYIVRSDLYGFAAQQAGLYRMEAEAYAYQAKTPVTLTLFQASQTGSGSRLLGAFDILPGSPRTVTLTVALKPGDYIYPSVAALDPPFLGSLFTTPGGAKNYQGEGVGLRSLTVEGPLVATWPPPSTRQLLVEVDFAARADGSFEARPTRPPLDQIRAIVAPLASRAFRRPLEEGEAESFVDLARPALADGRDFLDAVRIALRAVLSSPQVIFHAGEPGPLDPHALATRLASFLWKSQPDDELRCLADAGTLTDLSVLAAQVDRLLDDPKATRFVRDFVGQWLRLYEISATSPDKKLYPEFDDILRQAMLQETELFVADLIEENLSVGNLIDSKFTYLNRRLAEHYGIPGVAGLEFQKVSLPADSPRGGLLTQASILKVTANGTVTSPVKRGDFVLRSILGQPPEPPPANIGAIEPDTRGTTTIRELLARHRDDRSCASCHQYIDPPGFALESFDPIGGYRTRFRTSGLFGSKNNGPAVDASGATADGQSFAGIKEFKALLLNQRDQVARNFIAELVVYATGGTIEFADRAEVDRIAARTRAGDYPVRTILHEVVRSRLFRSQ